MNQKADLYSIGIWTLDRMRVYATVVDPLFNLVKCWNEHYRYNVLAMISQVIGQIMNFAAYLLTITV